MMWGCTKFSELCSTTLGDLQIKGGSGSHADCACNPQSESRTRSLKSRAVQQRNERQFLACLLIAKCRGSIRLCCTAVLACVVRVARARFEASASKPPSVKMLQQPVQAPVQQPASHASTHVAAEFDSHSDLVSEYISQGAIVRACGISKQQIDSDVSRWRDAATTLAHSLGFDGELDATQKQRIYQYYLPVFFWSLQQLQLHRSQGHSRPLVVRAALAALARWRHNCAQACMYSQHSAD